MKYNELVTAKQKRPTRVGRGISAGRGKTAGRGTKGQGARKSPTKFGFEGGQMPLHMRLPKLRGFKSARRPFETVYTGQLEQIKKTVIDSRALYDAGVINSPYSKVKLLLNGDLTSKKTVNLQSASSNAAAAVTKAGGSFNKTKQLARVSKKAAKTAE